MKTEQMIEAYEAPQVEIIEVAVEKGFAISPYSLEWTDEEGADATYGVY
ncbi:MAG: hypothetical protein IKK67_00595 [Bacteroidaceae bacterium]|nr:hypothetical protein [Bacteroidaceae bacterium]